MKQQSTVQKIKEYILFAYWNDTENTVLEYFHWWFFSY